jgi:ribosome-binding factor A
MISKSRTNHKDAQLCSQVEEVIGLSLGSARDSRLHQLSVHSVTSYANGARLTIFVLPTTPIDIDALDEVMQALEGAKPWLREQVAEEIHRKRCPDLAFMLLMTEGQGCP